MFKFADLGLKFKEKSVGRKTISLSSPVVIRGLWFFYLKKGAELFLVLYIVRVRSEMAPALLLWPLLVLIAAIYIYFNFQIRGSCWSLCFTFFLVSSKQIDILLKTILDFTWGIFHIVLTFSMKTMNESWCALSFVNQDPPCLIVNNLSLHNC